MMREGLRYQIHQQLKLDGSTEDPLAEGTYTSQKELRRHFGSVKRQHPLPVGFDWLICTENSAHFITTIGE